MEKRYAVIKDGYCITVVLWDQAAAPDWVYPTPHDRIIEDVNENVGAGDWYEEVEGIFYRPMSTPPDLPEELT